MDGRYVTTPARPTYDHAHDVYEKTTKQTGMSVGLFRNIIITGISHR